MVINEELSKIQKLCVLQVIFFSLKVFGIVFISSSYDSITSSHVITVTINLLNISHFHKYM